KQNQNTTERLTVLGQFCKLIPKYCLANVCAELNKEGIQIAARAFSIWSHIVSMIYCHMAHCISLNDICDGLQNFKGNLNDIRNATAPHRNTLSHANRTRDIALLKKLFWKTVEHYQQTHPKFFTQGGRSYFSLPRRFKRAIRAIDSTTIELIAKCMDWTKHRKHKAAAKVHVALNLISFIPIRVVTDSANHHDGSYMSELCGNMKSGDIAVMDRAYVDYQQLNTLTEQGVFWVTRSKSNMKVKVIKQLNKGKQNAPVDGKPPHYPIILKDEKVELTGRKSHKRYPRSFRHVSAKVPDSNGKEITVSFLSNNVDWAASSICDLYRCRWGIETFFKEIKQTLQIRTFVGFSRNAIDWQIWSALLTYLLMRIMAFLSEWKRDFKHFFTLMKGALWAKRTVRVIVSRYGTAASAKAIRWA
ncbi:MAG: IS4 family transposase, partial [Proteobacteria bacterium]|nr:IS4 family transposase [Pseudomonadota bacterium]